MNNKKEVYILYNYNKFTNDYEYVKEYYTTKELQADNNNFNLKNKKSIYQFIKKSLDDNISLLNDKYLIIKEVI